MIENDPIMSDEERAERLRTVPVEPVGQYTAQTVHGDVRVHRYPDETVRLGGYIRQWRVERAGLGLREAARLLGLPASTLSAVERGAARWVDPGSAYTAIMHAWGPS